MIVALFLSMTLTKKKGINNDLMAAIKGIDNNCFENYEYGKNKFSFN